MLFRKNCQNACANERDSIDEGSKVGEMPHPGGVAKVAWRTEAKRCCVQGLVAGGASAEACLHAKESRSFDGFEEKSLSHAKATIIRLKWRP